MDTTTKISALAEEALFSEAIETPVLLVAYAPVGVLTTDRIAVRDVCLVGRADGCHLQLREGKISRHHFRILNADGTFWIEDLGSTNGTFLNGGRVFGKSPLLSGSVIRVGRSVLVFLLSAGGVLQGTVGQAQGIAGRFHAAPLIRSLEEAVTSGRHLLLHGPSGTGKELAARVIAERAAPKRPWVVHNAAQFATEEEAATTLFGVEESVFSGVRQRKGIIEEAEKGVLFLDETHNLPARLQKSLLRVIENGETKRIGSNTARAFAVRFILASNIEDDTAGLAHDLFARLRVVRIPSLKERRADIPSIFSAVMTAMAAARQIDAAPLISHMGGDHMETLCLEEFERDNIRGLIDVADRILSEVETGAVPNLAVDDVFRERFRSGAVAARQMLSSSSPCHSVSSEYEQNKQLIVSIYQRRGGNVSAVARELKELGISCSRRWLTHYIKAWGLRHS